MAGYRESRTSAQHGDESLKIYRKHSVPAFETDSRERLKQMERMVLAARKSACVADKR